MRLFMIKKYISIILLLSFFGIPPLIATEEACAPQKSWFSRAVGCVDGFLQRGYDAVTGSRFAARAAAIGDNLEPHMSNAAKATAMVYAIMYRKNISWDGIKTGLGMYWVGNSLAQRLAPDWFKEFASHTPVLRFCFSSENTMRMKQHVQLFNINKGTWKAKGPQLTSGSPLLALAEYAVGAGLLAYFSKELISFASRLTPNQWLAIGVGAKAVDFVDSHICPNSIKRGLLRVPLLRRCVLTPCTKNVRPVANTYGPLATAAGSDLFHTFPGNTQYQEDPRIEYLN